MIFQLHGMFPNVLIDSLTIILFLHWHCISFGILLYICTIELDKLQPTQEQVGTLPCEVTPSIPSQSLYLK